MKINNVHIARFLWILITLVTSYASYKLLSFEGNDSEEGAIAVFVFLTLIHDIVFIIVLIVALMNDDIEFEISLPTPFKNMKEAYKLKRDYLEQLERIHGLMMQAPTTEDLDRLVRQKNFVEKMIEDL